VQSASVHESVEMLRSGWCLIGDKMGEKRLQFVETGEGIILEQLLRHLAEFLLQNMPRGSGGNVVGEVSTKKIKDCGLKALPLGQHLEDDDRLQLRHP
jgi:hypothetical protein